MELMSSDIPFTAEQHTALARYCRAMASAIAAVDVALSYDRLAVHYERLVRNTSSAPAAPERGAFSGDGAPPRAPFGAP